MSGSQGGVPGSSILQPFAPQQLQACAAASAVLRGAASSPGVRSGSRFTQLAQTLSLVPTVGNGSVVTLAPQAVGLVTKYYVEVVTTVTNPAAGSTLTRTPFGPFNQLSNISYTDPSQNQRINTYGWHIANVTAMRRRRVPGSALTTDSPTGFGSVLAPIAAPATIAPSTTATVRTIYEIPLSVGRNSLKGAIVAGTVFSNQQLQVTFNPNFCSSGTDPLNAGYTGAGTGANAPTFATTINLYQEYWDQYSQQLLSSLGPDLSTIYELKSTFFTPLVAGVNNFFRYSPLREYWSTVLAFDNAGVMNPGTDVNYFQLQAANQTTFWQRSPSLQSYHTRNLFADDAPAGVYLFDTHDDPIITAADGNTTLNMNPSTVNSGAVVYVGWEDIAIASVLASAPAISGQGGS